MLTILMATHNGARTLPSVLEGYCRLAPPSGGWKLIIIDNGSTDSTKQVIETFVKRLPLTYLSEPKRGKNIALNTGLRQAEGDLFVFTDDDAVPHSDWLEQLRSAADSQPSFSMFAGTILPKWEANPEPWIVDWVPYDIVFALTHSSWEEGPITPRLVFGPNSAYRSEIFKSYSFNPAIGPSGSNYAMGSEYEFNVRLQKAGFTAWHCKQAVVEHIIRKSQMNKTWVLGRAFRSGRGFYRVDTHPDIKDTLTSSKLIFGVPRYLIREIATQALSVVKAKLKGDDRAVFRNRWKLSSLIGNAYEARLLSKQGKQPKSDEPAAAAPTSNSDPSAGKGVVSSEIAEGKRTR
jgi:glycosyltransferase involved in cell wall biosynthesis